ncbi:hypothetical protein J5N97_013917 [Dioscorea zingiberensis]|uniref:Uncharacterized protein n=1 Tax=Dioscorea zingiberensis TaxID=325984 RepID=A0A9D5CU50_9LILI|nr:hypothetical protein J5N97_013917 [Dioscorea zingiberensis]
MSSGCMNSVSCVDARAPVRASYVNLYKWPDSDAEFVRSVTGNFSETATTGRRRWPEIPRVVDSYSCRQMYLRSYTFSKKESVPEKTRKCLAKVKVSINGSVNGYASNRRSKERMMSNRNKNKNKNKKQKKGCVVVVKKVLCSLFRRLLLCTTSVEVADKHYSSY